MSGIVSPLLIYYPRLTQVCGMPRRIHVVWNRSALHLESF
jgi:hypothetical protein